MTLKNQAYDIEKPLWQDPKGRGTAFTAPRSLEIAFAVSGETRNKYTIFIPKRQGLFSGEQSNVIVL